MTADRVAEPYMVHDPQQMAGEMMNGKWLVARWEHLGPDEDRPSWTRKIEFWCEQAGFQVQIVEIPRRSLTVLFNADLRPPTFEQIDNSISCIELARFTERNIGDKLHTLRARA